MENLAYLAKSLAVGMLEEIAQIAHREMLIAIEENPQLLHIALNCPQSSHAREFAPVPFARFVGEEDETDLVS